MGSRGMIVALAIAGGGCGRVGFTATDAGPDGDPQAGPPTARNSHVHAFQDSNTDTFDVAVSGIAGDVLLAVLSVKPAKAVTGVSGLGLLWQPIRSQCGGRDTALLAMYYARAIAPVDGLVVATIEAPTECAVLTVHVIGGAGTVSPIGNLSWANTTDHDGDPACAGGTDTMSYGWSSLDTTADGSLVVVAAHTARFSHEPGAGFVEISDIQSGDADNSAGVAVQVQSVATPTTDLAIAGSFSGAPDWIAIAAEIRD